MSVCVCVCVCVSVCVCVKKVWSHDVCVFTVHVHVLHS